MEHAFVTLLNMSISGSIVILLVIILRLVFKKAPKAVFLILWGIAAVRLILPVFIESPVGLMPRGAMITAQTPSFSAGNAPEYATQTTLPTEAPVTTEVPTIKTHEPAAPAVVSASFAPSSVGAVKGEKNYSLLGILSVVWICGAAAMTAYALISYLCLRNRLLTAVRLRENIYESEYVNTPFLLGAIRPKIYVPYGLSDESLRFVEAHEISHIKLFHHVLKPFGFLVLSVHWFNPVVWFGYALFSRDLELRCDESVISRLTQKERAGYSQTLLDLSMGRAKVSACPLAFGEGDAKARIRSVLSYKKPALWLIVTALAAAAMLAACSLTSGKKQDEPSPAPTETAGAQTTPEPTQAPIPNPSQKPGSSASGYFDDPGFERRMRDYLGLEDGEEITDSALHELSTIILSGDDIHDLSDMYKLKHVKRLVLNGVPNADLSIVSTFTWLTDLSIINCGIDDISFISGLRDLRVLSVNEKGVTDLSPISMLENIVKLSICCGNIKDLSPIDGLTLSELHITDCTISDPSFLGQYDQLSVLYLESCDIADISFLSGKSGLIELSLSGNRISDITPIAELRGLQHLDLSNNLIENIEPLYKIKTLKWVDLSWNPVSKEDTEKLNDSLSKLDGEASVKYYPYDRDALACWPVDLDGDGTNEYFYADLGYLQYDFVSNVWLEDASHRRLSEVIFCGTGHINLGTYAVVDSPEYGSCLLSVYPEFLGQYYGYSLMRLVNGKLETVFSDELWNYDHESEFVPPPEERIRSFEDTLNSLLASGHLLISTDKYGVLNESFLNKATGKTFEIDRALGVLSAYDSSGSGIALNRKAMEELGFVFLDEETTVVIKVHEPE